jgi:putative PIN family toxin of toxin-antitoxin system
VGRGIPCRSDRYPSSSSAGAVGTMKCVVDTNVVLDWLVFDDSLMDPFRVAVREGRVRIFTHPPAIDELRRVLSYPRLQLDATRQQEVLRVYQAQTSQTSGADLLPIGQMSLPKGFPHCRDPDDNHFLALAYHSQADALVSRDKAVLALRRRSGTFGFEIMSSQQLIAALQRV